MAFSIIIQASQESPVYKLLLLRMNPIVQLPDRGGHFRLDVLTATNIISAISRSRTTGRANLSMSPK